MTGIAPSKFLTRSMRAAKWGDSISRVLSASLKAVDPSAAVARRLRRDRERLEIAGKTYDLGEIHRIHLLSLGKAGALMALAAAERLGAALTGGLVIVKEGYAHGVELPPHLQLIESRHPIPDEKSVQAASLVVTLLESLKNNDLLLCLISGGGSALLNAPPEGVHLDDLQKLTASLLASGAEIQEINTLRKHLDRLKGGGLARLAAPARVESLILSDVIGDPVDMIASGPTAPDPTSYQDALDSLDRYDLGESVPESIRAHLEQGALGKTAETPKPGDPVFDLVRNTVIGSNYLAAQAALEQAQVEGYNAMLLTASLRGEAREIGRLLASIARQVAETGQPQTRPACIIAGGETTVTLTGDGLGGRNQELALAAVKDLAGLPEVALVAFATDGGDGPTDAAGAIATGKTQAEARRVGLEPGAFLQRNDAYHFFEALDDLLKPGPTLTNVNDLAMIFAF